MGAAPAFFAADSAPLTANDLAQLPPERYGALRLRLHPAVRWVTARYPIDRLWEATAMPAAVTAQPTTVLVMRPDLAVVHAVIEPAEAAVAHDPGHDLSAALARYLSRAVFSADSLNGQDGSA